MHQTPKRVTQHFLTSKHFCRTSTILKQLFLKLNCDNTILTQPLQRLKCVDQHLYHPYTSLLHVKIGVPYVYHVQRAIPDDKTHVRNVYHPHTPLLEVKTCFLNIHHPHSLCVSQNTCTKQLPSSHSLSWGQNALPEGLPSSQSLSSTQNAFLPYSHSHCRGKNAFSDVYIVLTQLLWMSKPLHHICTLSWYEMFPECLTDFPTVKMHFQNVDHPHNFLNVKMCVPNI